MLLRERLISEINALPVADLVIIQQVVFALSTRQSISSSVSSASALEVREALRHCRGNFADDIVEAREDRF